MTEYPYDSLRIYKDSRGLDDELDMLGIPALTDACEAIEQLTGFELFFDDQAECPNDSLWSTPIVGSDPIPYGEIGIRPGDAGEFASLHDTTRLLDALSDMASELVASHSALAEREAELASNIPVIAAHDDGQFLQERLEAVLNGICDGLSSQAAAIYLLDESTSELKMRAQCGLPKSRLSCPARSLRGAVGDLEALTGHAVVIEDTTLLPHWNTPEQFRSAVCVPISSPSILLGTFWVFCDQVRDFSPEETNLIEIAAGRIAAELERTVLLAETAQNKRLARFEEEVAHGQQDRLMLAAPIIDGWDVAGSVDGASDCIKQDFFHWRMLQDDRLALAVGGVAGSGGRQLLAASSLQSALQAFTIVPSATDNTLDLLNEFIWSNSPGDHYGSACYGALNFTQNQLRLSTSGSANAYLLDSSGVRSLSQESLMLGIDPDASYEAFDVMIPPGAVVIFSSDLGNGDGQLKDLEELLGTLAVRVIESTAEEAATLVSEAIKPARPTRTKPAILVVKRRR